MTTPRVLLVLSLAVLLLHLPNEVIHATSVTQAPPAPSGGKWCIAKPGATAVQLQANIDWGCSQGGVECQPIQAGGSCFAPDNKVVKASWVMNTYYKNHGRSDEFCNFNDTGIITFNDPSVWMCMD